MLKYIENKANSVPQQALSGAGLTLAKRNKKQYSPKLCIVFIQNYILEKKLLNTGFGWLVLDNLGRSKKQTI